MKIAIDAQTTLGQKTGFGFYVENLINQLERVDRKHEYIKLLPKSSEDFRSSRRWWWDQVTVPRLARRAGADLLHQPAFSAPFSFRGPVVVTVHDLIAIHFAKDIPFGSRLFFGRWMPFSYRFADHMIAVSEHTKRDVIDLLGIPESKITVIYEAAASEFRPIRNNDQVQAMKKKYQTGDKFLLHVGTLNPRKNLGFLIEVFAKVRKKINGNWKLVITGKKGWYYEGLFESVKRLKLGNSVVFTGYIDEQDKPALYNAASIFVFPSIYEGVGLPPLEAMRCGTPVVSSNTSSLPEMIGEGGILLSPSNKESWARALASLMTDAAARRDLSNRAKKQAKKFSWEKTARETVKVYEQVYRQYRKKHQ